MKQLLGLILIIFISINSYSTTPTTLVLSTYNLRCLTNVDVESGNEWSKRKSYVKGLIQFHGFDIFGTQELVWDQVKDMLTMMPEYSHVGAGRDDGKNKGEQVAIFYRTDKFELLSSGHFWLAEDESKPVKGWDAAYIRICTWGKFKVKETGFEFVYFNVHLDNEGEKAREESAKMIMAKMNALSPTLPAIMAGDFNASENSTVYQTLCHSAKLRDASKIADMVYCNNSSYNNFDAAGSEEGIIDYIFLSKEFNVLKYGLLTDIYRSVDVNGEAKARTPSDHFPIMLKLEVK